jgi:hypothetical protein
LTNIRLYGILIIRKLRNIPKGIKEKTNEKDNDSDDGDGNDDWNGRMFK